MSQEKRRHPRIESLNLSYVCVDQDGAVVQQSMGRTLDVSENGIRLETSFAVDPDLHLQLTVAFEDILVELGGAVVYCQPGSEEYFELGVEFKEMDDASRASLLKFIEHFQAVS